MPKLNPYLNFNGNAEEAFNFYKSVFGGEFATVMRFKDTQHGADMSDEDKEKIMHIALPLGGDSILMASDASGSMGHNLQAGNNFYISMNTDSKEKSDRLFNGLAAGGNVEMPIADTFWGDYFGMLRDKFGIGWMVSFNKGEQ